MGVSRSPYREEVEQKTEARGGGADLFICGITIRLKHAHQVHGLAAVRQREVDGHQEGRGGARHDGEVWRDVCLRLGCDESLEGC